MYLLKDSPEKYVGDSFYPMDKHTQRFEQRMANSTFLWNEEESIVRGSDSSEYKTTTMLVKDDLIWFTDFTRGGHIKKL